jgi:DNA-binding NarL/FixJ family response regulator
MTVANLPRSIYIVYHHGLFAQGVRSVLEEQCAVTVVGMESDMAKALKAVCALLPEVIIVEECAGKHQPMRLGAFLNTAAAGRVVTLSLGHKFATVYQRSRVPATDLDELVNAIQGDLAPPPTLGTDRQRGMAAISTQSGGAVVVGCQDADAEASHLAR